MNTIPLLFVAATLLAASMKSGARAGAEGTPPVDTCLYTLLKAPHAGDREAYRPFLDTTITRSGDCHTHILEFPSRGTVSTYVIQNAQGDTVQQFTFRTGKTRLWDISHVSGDHVVHLSAWHVAGTFRLSIR